MKEQSSNLALKNQFENGFTLLEVLVTTAIIGVLFTVSAAIFINTIRSANKANITNEAKDNASLLIEKLQSDIKDSTSDLVSTTNVATPNDTLTIKPTSKLLNIVWKCVDPATGNSYVTRNDLNTASGDLTVTNRDTVNGVSVQSCTNFFAATTANPPLVTVNVVFVQGSSAGASQDLTVLVRHKVSISARGY